jgi:hypothetical protein
MRKTRVYCKNCKYIWWDDRSPDMCREPYIKLDYEFIPYCEDLNWHKECAFYKRKWWKFWA